MQIWQKPEPVRLPAGLVQAAGGEALAEVLYRRGYTSPEAVTAFLTGGVPVDEPGLPDLEAGAVVLAEAVRQGARIRVYGDYDTDGVTATALLMGLLQLLGARADYYVPNRFRDGYGMNTKALDALAAEGTDMILTCDCGIRNMDEVRYARELGMRVVVTDHHELGSDLPPAEAVINPKRLPVGHPARMLPGVGTAYLLARRLLVELGRPADLADRWLDLVAVGIIADVVPLHGTNRELARLGLLRLKTSPCPGLLALFAAAGVTGDVTEEDLAFQVVPRLNSAGRLAEASAAVRLLLAEDPKEASELAGQLDQLNQERRRLTESVVAAASNEAAPGAPAIILYRPEWHEGVLGIAAGKLANERQVPVFLMARKHGGGNLVGSARAPDGIALHEVLEACGEHLLRHGGHAAAAGFTLLEDRLPAFRVAVSEEVRRRSRTKPAAVERTADLNIAFAGANRNLYEELRLAAPFGESNPAPVLFSERVMVLSSRPIGPGDKHLRLVLRDGGHSVVGVWWGAGPTPVEPGEVDLFYRLGLNRYNGEETLQAVVEHMGGGQPGVRETPAVPALRPLFIDRRGALASEVLPEFPGAVVFAEAGARGPGTVDRYGLKPARDLVMLWAPASPGLLDEALALTGARRVVVAWATEPSPWEERFMPSFMQVLANEMAAQPWISLYRLAVSLGELEAVVRLALDALADNDLLAVDAESGDLLRVRRRTDGHGLKESPALIRMRRLLAESRAFRRFLRGAPLHAVEKAAYGR